MGFMETVSGFFKARDKPVRDQAIISGGMSGYFYGDSSSGVTVTAENAMRIAAVYACVRIIAESIASLPLHLYRYKTDGSKERAVDDPLYFLLHDAPNPDMTSFVFRETMMTHILLWGNFYAQITRDGFGVITGLYPLMPDRVSVIRGDDHNLYYQYFRSEKERLSGNEPLVTLMQDEVLHVPGLGFNGLVGFSPIAMAKNAVGLTSAAEEYGASFYRNGSTPSGVLSSPNVLKNPGKIRESWRDAFGRGGTMHGIAVLEEGLKYEPISIKPNEAQFLETRKFQIDEIARIFRVPPHMIGDLEKSSFSNIEQQSLEFVKYTLGPWVSRIEQSLARCLFVLEEKRVLFVKFNVDGLMRGDYKSRMEGYQIARQNGWMNANDIRELEDMDPISDEEGGNLYLVNGNMMPLADAGAAYDIGTSEPDGGEDSSEQSGNSGQPVKSAGPNRAKNKKRTNGKNKKKGGDSG